jgi:hypothetical protein
VNEQMTALALVCSLKRRPAASSSEFIAAWTFANATGVETDTADGDAWPPRHGGQSRDLSVVGNGDGAHKTVADVFQALKRHWRQHSRAGLHLLERSGNGVHRLQRARRSTQAGRVRDWRCRS